MPTALTTTVELAEFSVLTVNGNDWYTIKGLSFDLAVQPDGCLLICQNILKCTEIENYSGSKILQ